MPQSSEGGGIEPADDIKPFAAAERSRGQFEEHQLPRIWRPPVRHLAPTNEPGPHFSHRICIVQWDAGEMASNEQVNHYEPTQEFARPRVGIEVAQLREGLDNFVYFRVGQRGHGILRDTGAETVGESVAYELFAVDGGDGDHLHVAFLSSVNQVAERVVHAFGDGVRTVNDEQALWCTQSTEQCRERAAQHGLELNRQLGNLPQVNAQRLHGVGIRRARSGEGPSSASALLPTPDSPLTTTAAASAAVATSFAAASLRSRRMRRAPSLAVISSRTDASAPR